jgi:hypothetical protein
VRNLFDLKMELRCVCSELLESFESFPRGLKYGQMSNLLQALENTQHVWAHSAQILIGHVTTNLPLSVDRGMRCKRNDGNRRKHGERDQAKAEEKASLNPKRQNTKAEVNPDEEEGTDSPAHCELKRLQEPSDALPNISHSVCSGTVLRR